MHFTNKLIVFALAFSASLIVDPLDPPILEVMVALIALAISLLIILQWPQKNVVPLIVTVFTLLCFAIKYPMILFFSPVLLYDLKDPPYVFLNLIVLFISFLLQGSLALVIFVATLMALSWYLSSDTSKRVLLLKTQYQTIDEEKYLHEKLKQKNEELVRSQNEYAENAVLTERNRIARDIHDHIGHVLSSAIIQLGALEVLEKDPNIKTGIGTTRKTLTNGMEQIRNSLHNMHESSLDFYELLRKTSRDFTFCPVGISYHLSDPLPKALYHSFAATINEGLTNVIKHSNATSVHITLSESNEAVHLLIQDNGTQPSSRTGPGIGLIGIEERAAALGGQVHISSSKGFRIFVSIPHLNKGE